MTDVEAASGVLKPKWAKLPWATLAIEVFSIVLGVLLALGVNEWRQDKADQKLANQARDNIFAELEANKKHLQITYRRNLVFQRQAVEEAEEQEFYQPAWGLQDTAWNVARDTGALRHMSFEAVSGFSSIYGFQQTYRVQVLQLTQAQMMGLLSSTALEEGNPSDLSRQINERSSPVVELLIRNEKELIEAYDKALSFR